MTNKYTNLITRYDLPCINRIPEDSAVSKMLDNVKVLNFSKEMPVQFESIVNHEKYISDLKTTIAQELSHLDQIIKKEIFNGESSSELNTFISSFDTKKLDKNQIIQIHIINSNIRIDEPVFLCDNISIFGNNTIFWADNSDIAIIARDVKNIKMTGINVINPKVCGIMFLGCENFYIENVCVIGSGHYGIVVRQKTKYGQIYSSKLKYMIYPQVIIRLKLPKTVICNNI